MNLLKEGKTNWKYILIVVILAIAVGGGILSYKRNVFEEIISLTKSPEIKKPEKVEIEKPEEVTVELDKCKDIEDSIAQDRCYTAQAIETGDEEYCKYITSDIRRHDCITKIAIKNKDIRICKEATSEVHCAGEFVKVFPQEKGEEILLKDEVTGWNIYRNLKYGFEFKYPPDFFREIPEFEPTIIPIECGCDKEQVMINDIHYCFWTFQDAALGTIYETYYYLPLRNKNCFAVPLMIKYHVCSRSVPEEKAKCEHEITVKKETLNQIVSTFQFFEVKKPEIEKPAEKPIEKIIFSSKEVSESWKSGYQEIFYKYHIYSMNSDGTSLKEIFSYSPRTSSRSIIRKFGNDKIWIFRVNNDSDSKIIDTVGNEVTNRYAPVGENPVELYLSPDETKTLFFTGFDEISVYDLQSGELKKFSIDFGVPGEFGISHFVDQNHIMIGWGDIYAVAIGLVRLDFEKGFAEIKDERNFSSLEGGLFYFNKEVIMGYENSTEGEQRIPPSILYTTNLNTGEKNIFYRDDTIVFEGYSISPDKKFIVFPAQPVFSDDITTLLIAKVDNLKKISVRKIDIPKMDSLLRIYWSPDNQKIIYFVPSTKKIIVIDILSGEISSVESPEENINIIGVFKETK